MTHTPAYHHIQVTLQMTLVPPPRITVRSSLLGNLKIVNISLANRTSVAMEIRDAQIVVTANAVKVCRAYEYFT